MASVTIRFEDDEESGKVRTTQEWFPTPEENSPLTPAQILGMRALGLEVEFQEDEDDEWTPDGPEFDGGPI